MSANDNANICVCCGAIIPEGRHTCPICDKKSKQKDENRGNTLCWSCSKFVKDCQWIRCLKPIPGWTAIKTKILVNKGKYLKSYNVKACPLFERSKKR